MNLKDRCLCCGGQMESIGVEKIQLGQYGFLSGNLGNLLAGGLEVEIFVCQECKKIELYGVSE